MLAMSLDQPWAWLLVHGYRTIDARRWSTDHRGLLAIHATRKLDSDTAKALRALGVPVPDDAALPRGAIVGVGKLVDCRPLRDTVEDARAAVCRLLDTDQLLMFYDREAEPFCGEEHPDQWGLVFDATTMHKLSPVAWPGSPMLWDVPADVLQRMRAAWTP